MSKSSPESRESPIVELQHCSIVLDGAAVLDDINFSLRANERWALVGPNGAGKTLFLKLLRGDMWPTPIGRERRLYALDGERSEQPVGSKECISYLGPERQDRYVRYEWNHSVIQVVTTGLFDEDIPRTKPTLAQQQRVASLLRRFRLWTLRDRGFLTLSYGQRRRALVARALVSSPKVLLLDEVFNGLDAVSVGILRTALAKQSTWIIATHRIDEVPRNATHVITMEQGKIVDVAERSSTRSPNRNVGSTRIGKGVQTDRQSNLRAGLEAFVSQRQRTPSHEPLIELRHVDLYRDYRLVLRDVNWTLKAGEHWAIVGHNGSGKSSFLKLLYGDLHPRLGGAIERAGAPSGTPISEWKQRVGFVSPELQADYFAAKNLEEVVISGRYASVGLNDAPTDADRRAARRWLTYFGIKHLAHRRPREVSYGQMRMALLARAMINEPDLLLLDEPCTGLAPTLRAEVLAMLQRLARRRMHLVMAVHDRRDIPPAVANVLVIESNKRVRADALKRRA